MDLPIVDRLKRELAELQHELERELPRRLEEARAHGDLRENAEYDAAKNRQGLVRARIAQTRARIAELSVYSLARIPHDRIAYGSKVRLEDIDSGEEVEYRIVFPEEVGPGGQLVSIASPLGKALINKVEGDEVVVQTPGGRRSYEVRSVVTIHQQGGAEPT